MPRIVKSGLIQMSIGKSEGDGTIDEIKEDMLQKHLPFIDDAGKQGVQILCLQEVFNTPYFCPGQDAKWYGSAEAVPGPTVERMAEYAKKYSMVMIVVGTDQMGHVPVRIHIDPEEPGLCRIKAAHFACGCGAEELLIIVPDDAG